MPRTYVLVLLGLKLPVFFLRLDLIGVCAALFAAVRAGEPRRRAVALAVLFAASLPIRGRTIESLSATPPIEHDPR